MKIYKTTDLEIQVEVMEVKEKKYEEELAEDMPNLMEFEKEVNT